MSERPTRRRTRATFADVWPAVPSTQLAAPAANSTRPAPPVTQPGALRESAPSSRPGATERTIAPRDQRISTETMEGKLMGHGAARYRFQPTETPSYYARLLTPGGLVTLWGRGLSQAIAQSTTHVRIGDRVAFRRLDQDPHTGRVQWRAEKPEWFVAHDKESHRRRDEQLAARRAAQEDPELARAMLSIKAAEAVAERSLSDPDRRLQFIAGVATRLKQTAQHERSGPNLKPRAQAQDRTSLDALRTRRTRDADRTR
jgi:hypothetical protein